MIAAGEYGMKLYFLPRTTYDQKKRTDFLDHRVENFTDLKIEIIRDSLLIPEGGAGIEGLRGSEEILSAYTTTRIYACMYSSGNRYNTGRN